MLLLKITRRICLMRCKNCGFENEQDRYICENCGSPLYDEDEDITTQQSGEAAEEQPEDTDKKNTRNSVIIIAVLAVLLIAMVTGIIIFASQGGKKPEQPASGVSTTEPIDEPEPSTKAPTTQKPTTTKPTTTEPTTEATTQATTEPETEATEAPAEKCFIAIDIDGYGTVTGGGTYEAGATAVLLATASEGSQFIGWYDNSENRLVASNNSYTVTVQKDLSLTARFETISTEAETKPESPEEEATEELTENAADSQEANG